MSVKLNTRQVGDVSVVDVAGRITLGEGSSALRDTLREMVNTGGTVPGDSRSSGDPRGPVVRNGPRASDVVGRLAPDLPELVDAVAGKTELRKTEASKAVDAVFEAIEDALKGGDEVRLVGFGTFSMGRRAARKGRNPATGAEIRIPAAKVAKFAAGAKLKKAVNRK